MSRGNTTPILISEHPTLRRLPLSVFCLPIGLADARRKVKVSPYDPPTPQRAEELAHQGTSLSLHGPQNLTPFRCDGVQFFYFPSSFVHVHFKQRSSKYSESYPVAGIPRLCSFVCSPWESQSPAHVCVWGQEEPKQWLLQATPYSFKDKPPSP